MSWSSCWINRNSVDTMVYPRIVSAISTENTCVELHLIYTTHRMTSPTHGAPLIRKPRRDRRLFIPCQMHDTWPGYQYRTDQAPRCRIHIRGHQQTDTTKWRDDLAHQPEKSTWDWTPSEVEAWCRHQIMEKRIWCRGLLEPEAIALLYAYCIGSSTMHWCVHASSERYTRHNEQWYCL